MLLFPDKQLAIYTPPKTASTAPTDLPRSNYFDAHQPSLYWSTCLSRAVIETLRPWREEDLQRFSYKIRPDELPPYPPPRTPPPLSSLPPGE